MAVGSCRASFNFKFHSEGNTDCGVCDERCANGTNYTMTKLPNSLHFLGLKIFHEYSEIVL